MQNQNTFSQISTTENTLQNFDMLKKPQMSSSYRGLTDGQLCTFLLNMQQSILSLQQQVEYNQSIVRKDHPECFTYTESNQSPVFQKSLWTQLIEKPESELKTPSFGENTFYGPDSEPPRFVSSNVQEIKGETEFGLPEAAKMRSEVVEMGSEVVSVRAEDVPVYQQRKREVKAARKRGKQFPHVKGPACPYNFFVKEKVAQMKKTKGE